MTDVEDVFPDPVAIPPMVGGSTLDWRMKHMSNSNRARVSVSCMVIVLAAHASAAFAALSDDPPSLKLTYQDRDLATVAGAEDFYRRINRAATEVCLKASDRQDPTGSPSRRRQCVQKTVSKAVRDVDHPLVSAQWKQQTRVAAR
jgi:UrcA family protein